MVTDSETVLEVARSNTSHLDIPETDSFVNICMYSLIESFKTTPINTILTAHRNVL